MFATPEKRAAALKMAAEDVLTRVEDILRKNGREAEEEDGGGEPWEKNTIAAGFGESAERGSEEEKRRRRERLVAAAVRALGAFAREAFEGDDEEGVGRAPGGPAAGTTRGGPVVGPSSAASPSSALLDKRRAARK